MTVTVSEPRQQAGAPAGALTMVRVIRAKRERVYRAWTDPVEIVKWFAPAAMTVTAAEADVRVGGRYRIAMKGAMHASGDGHYEVVITGTYAEVMPLERLRFTWLGSWDEGEKSLVTVTFRDVEGGTQMNLHHERFLYGESRTKHEQGWGSSLAKLAAAVE